MKQKGVLKNKNIHHKVGTALAVTGALVATAGLAGGVYTGGDTIANGVKYRDLYNSITASEDYIDYINEIIDDLSNQYKAGEISYDVFAYKLAEIKEGQYLNEYIKTLATEDEKNKFAEMESGAKKYSNGFMVSFGTALAGTAMLAAGAVASAIGDNVEADNNPDNEEDNTMGDN